GTETLCIPLRLRPTHLGSILTSTMAVMRAQAAAADVSLDLVVDDDLPDVVHLDSDKIAWAIATLVGNALRYIRSGPRRMPGGTIGVEIASQPEPSTITVTIRDDGPDIPRVKLDRLFRYDDAQGPSGLSLLLVQDIVAAHGGRVDVQSTTEG